MKLLLNCFVFLLFLGFNFSYAQASGDETFEIPINPMQNFSGLGRVEIINKRIEAVRKLDKIFDFDNYSINSGVYQIDSGLPWISAYEVTCYGQGTRGASRESFGILNPLVMYYPLMASYDFSKTTGCSEVDYLLVNKLSYQPKQKLITAHIDYSSFYEKNKVFYRIHLSDTNARDLGYNYAYASNVKNINFAEDTNISNVIVPTRGFYHRGVSCGVSGGCNNYSPRQIELEFYITSLPAELYVKLWKKQPADKNDVADMNYHLIFQ